MRYVDDTLQVVVPMVVDPSEEQALTSQRTLDLAIWVELPNLVEMMAEETKVPNPTVVSMVHFLTAS
jgi:hypothetical protein